MSEPKFQIGDLVVHCTTQEEVRQALQIAQAANDKSLAASPRVGVVTHVWVEKCHGGCTQITYGVEGSDYSGTKRWIESAMIPAQEAMKEVMPIMQQIIKADRQRKLDMRKAEVDELWNRSEPKQGGE
jgi:hypothetical protein